MITTMTSRDGYFGHDVAEEYDDPDDPMFSSDVVDPTVDVLAELADGGAALELAIGTGRVALPLAAKGVRVEGVDLLAAMIEQMRRKTGGGAIPAVVADMATVRLARTFALVYLVFNALGNVTSQDGQVRVFEPASAHLHDGGRFVTEVGVPDLQRLPRGERFRPFTVDLSHVSASTSTTSSRRAWFLTTTGYATARPSSPFDPSPSATSGQLNSTSWLASLACSCAIGGEIGTAARSPHSAKSTCRSGRRGRHERALRASHARPR